MGGNAYAAPVKNSPQLKKIAATQHQAAPYQWIVCLQIKFKNIQNILIGTGTIVKVENRWYVLTCTHTILDQKFIFAQKIIIHSFLNKLPTKFLIQKPSYENCWFDKRYETQSIYTQHNFEFTLINLHDQIKQKYSNIEDYKDKLKIKYGWRNKPYLQVDMTQLMIIGYSSSSLKKNNFNFLKERPYCVKGKRKEELPQYPNNLNLNSSKFDISKLLFYQLSTLGGQSGGPIIILNKFSQYEIVGLHKGAQIKQQKDKTDKTDKNDKAWYNFGVCFNHEDQLKKLIPQNYK